ncbi:helix-turn-helix domain-containing protein [Paradesertivirga mongoliensis]|uniref:Helix-turn-helix domain-containing protein n=1 Tax=Paradesertivirga mongoliensis TaxID=2100740 RepID=A0ABW4ZI96_9SPHI|nr:helix-turn-helix domain-containing protein [Pedobacter mongoliensis]
MSKLLAIRQKQNLTQEELFEKTGISVRTIQRIEAGTTPKGYTLKALAKGLGVSEDDLVEKEEVASPDETKWLKLINLSALPCMFLPPLNIVAPLLIMLMKKQFTPVTRKVVTIQIVWTLIALILISTVMMLNDWFGIRSKYMMLIPVVWLLVNSLVILRNAAEIDKNNRLRISTGFSLI